MAVVLRKLHNIRARDRVRIGSSYEIRCVKNAVVVDITRVANKSEGFGKRVQAMCTQDTQPKVSSKVPPPPHGRQQLAHLPSNCAPVRPVAVTSLPPADNFKHYLRLTPLCLGHISGGNFL
jgi:hypothetical protein